jgi:hypothetical protein
MIAHAQSALLFPPPAGSALPAAFLASDGLNGTTVTGSIFPMGNLEDQASTTVPTPYHRLAGTTEQPFFTTPSSARVAFPENPGFKGTDDTQPEEQPEYPDQNGSSAPSAAAVDWLLGGPTLAEGW